MKILCCGDQHWTDKKPKNRTDDYFVTLRKKLGQELRIAKEEGCEVVIFPGDLFDSFKESHYVVQSIMRILKLYDFLYLAVAGQHDQKFHNTDLSGTALATLIQSGDIILLEDNPISFNGVDFYGSSWKSEIPEIKDPKKINVLAIHKMIVDEKLWAQQEGHTWANHILLKNKFDLIVSGDNHRGFHASSGNKHLVNCGSMMRSTIAQVEHKPSVAIYDTKNKTVDWVELDVKSMEEVMCIDKAAKEKEKNANLDAFVESLKEGSDATENASRIHLNFAEALKIYIDKNNIPEDVADAIYDCF